MPRARFDMPTLILLQDASPRRIPLTKGITTIGGASTADVVLPEPGLALLAANIVFDGSKFFIQQIDRDTALRVNNRKQRQADLRHEDLIEVGRHRLRFLIFDEENRQALTRVGLEKEAELGYYKKILDFTRELMEDLPLEAVFGKLMDEVIEIAGADKGFLVFMEEVGPRIIARRSADEEEPGDERALPMSDSIIRRVIETGEPVLVLDAFTDRLFGKSKSVSDLKLKSVMAVPLKARGELLGLIYVGNDKVSGLFEEKDLEVLKIFASMASLVLKNALLVDELKSEVRQLEEDLEIAGFGALVGGESEGMKRVFSTIEKVAPLNVSVLITGETGTGKELIAREIHKRSGRARGPFVAVNCSAIPETLFEDTFFGHVRGAFTGAVVDSKGKFQEADGGTLFLDEIGEMPLGFQPKLLRVLQEFELTRLGSNKVERVDVRIIAATNQVLEERIRIGHFREDLYYRLNEIPIHVLPLRERGRDLEYLANYFLKKYSMALRNRNLSFSREALAAMRKAAWPGNVRQLENRIKKAVVMAEGSVIAPKDLELEGTPTLQIRTLEEARNEFQRQYVREIIQLNNGNKAKTAKDLNVHPRTIYRIVGDEP